MWVDRYTSVETRYSCSVPSWIISPHPILWPCLSLSMGFTNSVRMAGQQPQWFSCLCLQSTGITLALHMNDKDPKWGLHDCLESTWPYLCLTLENQIINPIKNFRQQKSMDSFESTSLEATSRTERELVLTRELSVASKYTANHT